MSSPEEEIWISRESHEYWLECLKTPTFGDPDNRFDLERLRQMMAVRQDPVNSQTACLPVNIDGVPGEWIVAPNTNPEIRLLYLHGGGYVSGSGGNYLQFAEEISATVRCAVLLLDYRLAPEYPFPAGLEDCVKAHEWMVHNGPVGPSGASATFISGDSAGGGLTLSTLLALRDRHLQLPLAGISLSAFADLSLQSESIRSEARNEAFMHPGCLPDFVHRYVPDGDVKSPLVSPVYGDYAGIPPLLIQVGAYEIIRDDSIRVAEKARSAGVNVTLEVWPGQVHVFQIRSLPESSMAIDHIRRFTAGLLNGDMRTDG
jgi:epsilon-lactone hydrolase